MLTVLEEDGFQLPGCIFSTLHLLPVILADGITCCQVGEISLKGLRATVIEYYFVGLFLILTGRESELTDDVHELTLCLETVRQQFVHVLELIFLHDPIKTLVQSPEVLMVGEQRAVGLDPRAEDMHVIVLRVAVEVDEIRTDRA